MISQLKQAVKLAAKLREDSWIAGKSVYTVTLQEASDEAAESVGFDMQGTEPVYLLLSNSWNQALKWANE